MSAAYSEESFLRDVAEHAMLLIRDDGVSRHVRFAQPGTGCMHFDLITWPGYLCYTGDMGTYVFQRLTDMFEFFRTDREYKKRNGAKLAVNLPTGAKSSRRQIATVIGSIRPRNSKRMSWTGLNNGADRKAWAWPARRASIRSAGPCG